MKCVFVIPVDVNPRNVPESQKNLIQFRFNTVGTSPQKKPIPYFPAGTVYEMPDAWKHCQTGTAAPGDEDCRVAAGMTEADLKAAQRIQKIAAAGIVEADIELFDAGVITGYEMNGDYKPGPNYASYMAAQKLEEAKQTTGTDI